MIKESQLLELIDRLTLKRIVLHVMILIFVFSIIYWIITWNSPLNGLVSQNKLSFSSFFLFSIMSFFSFNYGDLTAQGVSILISVIEMIFGYLFLGILISKIVAFKQEKITKSIYSIVLEKELHNFRIDLQKLRLNMRSTSNKILWDREKNWKNLLDKYFKKETDGNYIEFVSTKMVAIHTLIRTEKEKWGVTPIPEVNKFAYERILHSIYLSLNEIKRCIDKFNQKKCNWKSGYFNKKMKFTLKYTDLICAFVLEQAKTEYITKTINEILELKNNINGLLNEFKGFART